MIPWRAAYPPLSGLAAFAQAPGFHETITEHRHQALKLGIVDSKLAQMQHRVDDIVDIRARFPGAPPDEPRLHFQRDAASILPVAAIDDEAQGPDMPAASVEKLHWLLARVIGIHGVFPALKVKPCVERPLLRHPEGHAFAFAALIEAEDQAGRRGNAPMHHRVETKRPVGALYQRVRGFFVSKTGPPHQRAVGENP